MILWNVLVERGNKGNLWSDCGKHRTRREADIKKFYFEGKGERVQIRVINEDSEGCERGMLVYETGKDLTP